MTECFVAVICGRYFESLKMPDRAGLVEAWPVLGLGLSWMAVRASSFLAREIAGVQ